MGNVELTFFVDNFSEALEKGHIHAFYQPIYRAVTGKMMSAESLARWIDPDKGMFSPALFIPALEESGQIFELDMEILRQTCAFYDEMRRNGTFIPSFSVNLSRSDFKNGDLYYRVTSTIDAFKVPHDAINLEVTENLMIDEPEVFREVLQKFNNAGFTLWMDDFGSGYSSLNVLKNYNFGLMKFDMVFMRDFSVKGRKLLASLINMAKSLGIHTLMEGIEREDQQQFMIDSGCEALQGFIFSKPRTKEELSAMVREKKISCEESDDRAYWEQIGRLNFLSANPIEDFAGLGADENTSAPELTDPGIPLALLECTKGTVKYVYASESYKNYVKNMGFDTLEEIEADFNGQRTEQALLMKKFMDNAIELGTIQKVEYTDGDVYLRLNGICVARKKDTAMVAYYLNTFETDKEVETANELILVCNSLFSTYEVAVLIHPESGIINRIHTAIDLPTFDKEKTMDESVRKFCEAEVDQVDRERYLKFLDFNTAFDRVESSGNGFIQGYFRMHLNGCENVWYSARLSRVADADEVTYLLTIQSLKGKMTEWLDMIAKDHPEMLE